MPSRYYGITVQNVWVKITHVLTHHSCDFRIIQSVCMGYTEALCQILQDDCEWTELCVKIIRPRIRDMHGTEFPNYYQTLYVFKNGLRFDIVWNYQDDTYDFRVHLIHKSGESFEKYQDFDNQLYKKLYSRNNKVDLLRLISDLTFFSTFNMKFWKAMLFRTKQETKHEFIVLSRKYNQPRQLDFRISHTCFGVIYIEVDLEIYKYYYNPHFPDMNVLLKFIHKVANTGVPDCLDELHDICDKSIQHEKWHILSKRLTN